MMAAADERAPALQPAPSAEDGDRRRREAGNVSLWVLYWSLTIMFLAGFGLDLWRGVAVRRALLEQAEAAAAAGANGIDTEVFRTTGDVVLDPGLATALAADNLAAQGESALVEGATVTVDPVTQEVTVTLTADVDFTLIRVFLADQQPLEVGVDATAGPRIGAP